MNQLNSVLIEGHLTQDPQEGHSNGENPLCKMSIASNRSYKKGDSLEEEVSYFDIESWGRIAQNCMKYLEKGRPVRVVGRLKQHRWSSNEGTPRNKIVIIAEQVEFLNKRSKEPLSV